MVDLLDQIIRAAEDIEELRWRAEAYEEIALCFEDKPMSVVPGVDHTFEPEAQVRQLIERTVYWDEPNIAWALRRPS